MCRSMSPRSTAERSLLLITLLLAGGFASSCRVVRFNERQRLDDPVMQFDSRRIGTELRGHILSPREGATGGFSSAGAGGCGCY